MEHGAAFGHTHAQRVRLSGRPSPRHFVGGEPAARAWVHPATTGGLRARPLGVELLGRAEARVQVAGLQQYLDVVAVDAGALDCRPISFMESMICTIASSVLRLRSVSSIRRMSVPAF